MDAYITITARIPNVDASDAINVASIILPKADKSAGLDDLEVTAVSLDLVDTRQGDSDGLDAD